MIPQDQLHVFDRGLSVLETFGRQKAVRGRFIALYLGLRRMHDAMAPLGDADRSTSAGEIEHFLDQMLTKTHRRPPFVVLTTPFGGSRTPNAPYSAPTSATSPGRGSATNTWRNNFQIQKGIGCPADPQLIESLLWDPEGRRACPLMVADPKKAGGRKCSITDTKYRGEKHSIWLRHADDGYQVVDLDVPSVYEPYLLPGEDRIPVFALIAVLYGFAPPDVYPPRDTVDLHDFAEDFHFGLEQVADIFDVNPESPGNAAVLEAAQPASATSIAPRRTPAPSGARSQPARRSRRGHHTGELPPEADPIEMNTGLGAERLVAQELVDSDWEVEYRGNQRSVGFDLQARRGGETLAIEVKSSVSFAQPELTQAEWIAAQALGESYVLAIVDFYGTDRQRVWYVRDPAGNASTSRRSVSVFRVQRGSIVALATEAESL